MPKLPQNSLVQAPGGENDGFAANLAMLRDDGMDRAHRCFNATHSTIFNDLPAACAERSRHGLRRHGRFCASIAFRKQRTFPMTLERREALFQPTLPKQGRIEIMLLGEG